MVTSGNVLVAMTDVVVPAPRGEMPAYLATQIVTGRGRAKVSTQDTISPRVRLDPTSLRADPKEFLRRFGLAPLAAGYSVGKATHRLDRPLQRVDALVERVERLRSSPMCLG